MAVEPAADGSLSLQPREENASSPVGQTVPERGHSTSACLRAAPSRRGRCRPRT